MHRHFHLNFAPLGPIDLDSRMFTYVADISTIWHLLAYCMICRGAIINLSSQDDPSG